MRPYTDTDRAEARDNYVRLRVALEARQPVPDEARGWLLAAMAAYEAGAPLEAALGLDADSGAAWRHPARQLRRAQVERAVLRVADMVGPRDSTTARRIAQALAGERFGLPSPAGDFLQYYARIYGAAMPHSRTAIERIVTGNTRAQVDGAMAYVVDHGPRFCLKLPDYSNTADDAA